MSVSSQAAEPQLNATPLIDVLLVLLVMLIFTLPVMTHNVSLSLPVSEPTDERPAVVLLEIDFDGTILWNGNPVKSIEELERRLHKDQAGIPAMEVHFSSDPRARYEIAAQVLAATQRAHVRKLSIVNLARL